MASRTLQIPFHRKRTARQRLGRRGETLAARLLRELGAVIILRNYTWPGGEVDIVARDGTTLCFIEVKSRHRSDRSRPIDTVSAGQKARIIHAAKRYRREIDNPPVPHRYDIVEVVFERGRPIDLRHWPAAYTEDDIVRTESGRWIDRRDYPNWRGV